MCIAYSTRAPPTKVAAAPTGSFVHCHKHETIQLAIDSVALLYCTEPIFCNIN